MFLGFFYFLFLFDKYSNVFSTVNKTFWIFLIKKNIMGLCCSICFSQELQERAKPLSFEHEVCRMYCIRVIDGDTIVGNVKTRLGIFEFHIRLMHLDAPEMKSADPIEKKHALACKKTLSQFLEHKQLHIKCGKFDKYGRLLGELFLNNVNINSWMLQNTPCCVYEGKSKTGFVFTNVGYCAPEYIKNIQED